MTDSLTKLIESAAIKPGTILNALVGRSLPLQGQQRAQLAELWLNTAKQQGSMEEKPVNNQKLQMDIGPKAKLLQQQKLHAIELKTLNSTQWVISQQPLPKGQVVQVQLRDDRQFQLLNSPTQRATKSNGAISSQSSISMPLSQQAATQVTNTNDGVKIQSATKNHQQEKGNTLKLKPDSLDRPAADKVPTRTLDATKIRYYLRHTLPYEQNLPQVLKQLQQVLMRADSLKPNLKTAIVEPRAWQILEKLVSSVRSVQEIENPKTLKSTIENSGVFYESKNLGRHATAQGKSPSLKPSFLTENSRSPSLKNVETTQSLQKKHGKIASDTKALLNELLQLTQLPEPNSSNRSTRPVNSVQQSSALLFHTLNQLQGLDVKNRQAKELASTVKQQIQSLARGALFKITGLQLQQLMQQTSDVNPLSNGAIIELPIRVSEHVLPLTIYIEEKSESREEEQQADDDKKAKQDKKRKTEWQVFLEFDLEQLGKFASQIKLVENTVQAKFWTENSALRRQAQQQLTALRQKMEQSGIEVTDIAVTQNKPPTRNTSLGCSLVNVTT